MECLHHKKCSIIKLRSYMKIEPLLSFIVIIVEKI